MGTYQSLYERLKDDPEALQQEIEDAVRINREAILTDMVRQAQTYMTWAYLHALAETDAKRLKFNMEEDVLPLARVKATKVLKEAKEKVTIAAKDDLAHSDPSYKQVQAMFITATQRAAIFKRVVEAMGHKRDMIQSLNSRQKVELSALPEDDAVFQQKYARNNETFDDVVQRVTDAHQEEHLTPNHRTVETECADLARQYRDLRREKRKEA